MKKIVLCFTIFLMLFLTSCQKKTTPIDNNEIVKVTVGEETFKLTSQSSLNNIHFNENYIDFNAGTASSKMHYIQYHKNGDVVFEIRVLYEDTHSFEENKKVLGQKESERTINGLTYAYFNYKLDTGETAHTYMYNYNDITYTVMFVSKIDITNLEETFMKYVYFE